ALDGGGDRVAVGHASGAIETCDARVRPIRLARLGPRLGGKLDESGERRVAISQQALAFGGRDRLLALNGLGMTVWDLNRRSPVAHLGVDRGDWMGRPEILAASADGRRALVSMRLGILEEIRLPERPGSPIERAAFARLEDGTVRPAASAV